MKPNYYNLKQILKCDAQYNVIYGARSNGKTFSVLEYGISQYYQNNKQMAIIRRWKEDFTGNRGLNMFTALIECGKIAKITNNEWTAVYYYASKWYLCRYENGEKVIDENPFAFGFSISSMEHDKSTSYPYITTILFDEFLTRTFYLPDEFVLFMNTVSTIIRNRNDVKIFMLGNSVTKFCPYFKEMGLKHITDMKQGTIDIYNYGDSGLKVAVEYVKNAHSARKSDVYFAFDNPRLKMITDGDWELDIYPHCPIKYYITDIIYTFFIEFNNELLQCDIVNKDIHNFIFIHRKTTEIKNPDYDLVYTTEYDSRPNYKRKITTPTTPLENKIIQYFKKDKIFYQDNEVGEIIRNYLMWCKK